ncbi:hypothetical protein SAMN05444372_101149 [Flavobacterium micromati]|uniref:Uncharacterized protein n=1 Tax=Flavobacterium micromati TaxID=229205 RepID=A0A1M5FIL9_9FLAO|nr:hypothetical protein [Flavobacterium micromati]SHF91336.1 hypothetical protein SAMN05444372_101149 [Flavobacterium micromati]
MNELEQLSYERFKNFNPKLTIRMYNYLKGNGSLWKVLCGIGVKIQWENEVLEEVWWLKNGDLYKDGEIYKNRFNLSSIIGMEW